MFVWATDQKAHLSTDSESFWSIFEQAWNMYGLDINTKSIGIIYEVWLSQLRQISTYI